MAHSYCSSLYHCIFSTLNRQPLITAHLQERLFPYMGGIARESRMKALIVGGIEDHAHVLLSLPSTLSIAKALQTIKGNSSKWVHDTFPVHAAFEWQEGYGAFSISISDVERTIQYINNQQTHHKGQSFQDELRAFLRKHGIEVDERYLWG
jgi:REP element-mobilizing transposase RayT